MSILLCSICLLALQANAQDLHFSQYYNAPLTVNPANTGFIPDGNYRIGANFRQQWASVPVPYTTMSAWGDMQVMKNENNNGWFGLGLHLLSDRSGDGNLVSNKIYGSFAYHQGLGDNSLLSAGFSVGYVSKRVDLADLKFVRQWTGKFIDNQLPSGESITEPSTNYFDFHAGLNYAIFPTDDIYMNLGVSMMHINQPNETLFGRNSGVDNTLSPRYTVFLNGSFRVREDLILNPSAYYSNMATASELMIGGNAEYRLVEDGSLTVLGGLYYRRNDAVVPMLGFSYNNLYINFTYDATVSSIRDFIGLRGGPEVSIIQRGLFGKGGTGIKCPSFKQ